MDYTCYYCNDTTANAHLVTFYSKEVEQNELLCEECYREWLASLKG